MPIFCRVLIAAVAVSALAACNTRPQPGEIFVVTSPPGATCQLSRGGQQIAKVDPTPGIALVDRERSDEIAVECRRSGFLPASAVVRSRSADITLNAVLRAAQEYDYEGPVALTLTPTPR